MSSYRRWTRDQEVLPILLSLFAFHTNPVSRTLTDCPMAWSVLRMMQTPDSIPSLIPPTTPNMSVHLERPMVPSYRQLPLIFQRHAAPVVAEPPVRNPFPVFVLHSITPRLLTDPPTVQAYDRPVFFADDLGVKECRSPQPSTGHKRNPTMPASSRHHSSSGTSRKQALKRSNSFSEFVAPHLIGRASNSPSVPTATPTSNRRTAGARGRSTIPSSPPPPYEDEKKKPASWSSSPTSTLSELPTLSSSPPPLPEKDYPASSPQQSDETRTPHVAMRLTARVLGRAKSGQRSPKGQSGDGEWVVV